MLWMLLRAVDAITCGTYHRYARNRAMLPKPTTHILPPVGTGDKPLLLDLHRLTRQESTIDHLIEYRQR